MRHGNVIPSGASYFCRAQNKYYHEGDIMPNPQTGDIYRFGDYEYAYNLANTNDMENDFDDESVLSATLSDKKMEAGRVKFVVLKELGNAIIDKSITKDDMTLALIKLKAGEFENYGKNK